MYRMYDLIMKKRNGGAHTQDEIEFIVNGFTKGEIPDYQMSAWLMCVYYNGMTSEETVAMTQAMADSGDRLSLADIRGVKVDKHSTGGVGDKTTFIVAPIVASLGVPVAKMSGRGLGHTGGTIDKLEAIPGFCVSMPEEQFIRQVNEIGLALVGQTGELAPADKKIYALRDVTAAVDSLPLIASSIMSKKLASGADAIVLDVKCGSGAFMRQEKDAEALAKTMVDIGNAAGRKCYGVITDMNEPLGCKVGNALEVIEAVQVLRMKDVRKLLAAGQAIDNHEAQETDNALDCDLQAESGRNGYDVRGMYRLLVVSITLASYMLMSAGVETEFETAQEACIKAIESGTAYQKFAEFVGAQGGDVCVLEDVDKFSLAEHVVPVKVTESGYIAACDTSEVGRVNMILGGGRVTKESTIDLGVGLDIRKHIGDYVQTGDVLAYLYVRDMGMAKEAEKRLLAAYTIRKEPVVPGDIVRKIIR